MRNEQLEAEVARLKGQLSEQQAQVSTEQTANGQLRHAHVCKQRDLLHVQQQLKSCQAENAHLQQELAHVCVTAQYRQWAQSTAGSANQAPWSNRQPPLASGTAEFVSVLDLAQLLGQPETQPLVVVQQGVAIHPAPGDIAPFQAAMSAPAAAAAAGQGAVLGNGNSNHDYFDINDIPSE
jgi:hypothetical protein